MPGSILIQQNASCQDLQNHNAPQPIYTFPPQRNEPKLPSSNHRRLTSAANQHHEIYINPNPSTTSTGFRSASGAVGRNQQLAAKPNRGYSDGTDKEFSLLQSSRSSSPSNPSNIGRGEQSQLVEWPFFKSLQSARKNFQDNNVANSNSNSNNPKRPEAAIRSSQDQSREQQRHKSSDGNGRLVGSASDQVDPSREGERGKLDLASGLAVESAADESTSAKMLIETTTNEPPATTSATEASTLETSEANTTPSPPASASASASTKTPTTTMPMPTTTIDPLFLPEFHKSIQKAVNRLVKMSTESMSAKRAPEDSGSDPKGSSGGGGTARIGAGNGSNPRSSLSLNVLLKNFGVHNLTNLDQILLKSTLKNDSHGRGQDKQKAKQSKRKEGEGDEDASGDEKSLQTSSETTSSDPKIEINGVLMDTSKNLTMLMGDTNDDDNSSGGREMAECKIEYTMKHVNITLMNGAGSDYSCDYIIDRKLHQGGKNESSLSNLIDGKKVCKLQLTSSFFSNHDLSHETQEAANGGCNGTYLAIGERRFCYLQDGNKEGQFMTLDRVFDFPIERDDFDIKMVHKRRGSNAVANDDDNDDGTGKHDESNEIHLEIKPLSDKSCPSQSVPQSPSSGVEYLDNLEKNMMFQPPSTLTTSTTLPVKPPTGSQPNNVIFPSNQPARDPRQFPNSASTTATNNSTQRSEAQMSSPSSTRRPSTGSAIGLVAPARRKFIIKQPQDKLLHPLNNRFKASQTFDQPATTTTTTMPDEPEICDGTQHDAAMGQLLTPEYPQYYRANMSCLFIIRRASPSFCQLVLHFRDFDLINDNNDCREDYLRIGTTRYCNKYAMIGHKMRLDFSSSTTTDGGNSSKLELEFRSDHMRSGRGFLIKYHQVPCEQQQQAADQDAKRKSVTQVKVEPSPISPKQRTIAPPLQQPDFGLALRTKTPSTKRPDGQKSTEATIFNNNSIESKQGPANLAANKTQDKGSGEATSTTVSSVMVPMASSVSTNSLAPSQGAQMIDPQQQQQLVARDDPSLDCNQVHSAMSFTLQSPNFPNLYENGLQCLYYVRRNNTRVCYLELTFIRFDLEADADCRYDYLEINGVRLCGSIKDLAHKTTRIYMFNEPIKAIKFHSDNSGAKSGFLIRADQLECGLNGSIMRKAKSGIWDPLAEPQLSTGSLNSGPLNLDDIKPDVPATPRPQAAAAAAAVGPRERKGGELPGSTVFQTNHSITRTFEYDSSALGKWPAARQRGVVQVTNLQRGHVATNLAPANQLQAKSQSTGGCDELLVGKEATIRSPLWPESYANDESISQCRYTILRETSSLNTAKNMKICQLELRFVNLRLGVSDCIDVDGYEVLCGFNTRNMVKYYPFDRQSHLTINFFTGASKLASARSLQQTTSDLLPARGPLRFMIIARQHECIDDFLAPQADLATSYNQTNLLYSAGGTLLNSNRTSSPATQTSTTRPTTRPPEIRKTDALLRYDFSSSILSPPTARPSPSPAPKPTNSGGLGAADHLSKPILMYSLINPQAQAQAQPPGQQDQSAPEGGLCLVQFGQYNGILSSYSVLSKLRLSTGPHQSFNECQVKLKLLPGFCKLQVTFGEFDLNPRIKNRCIGEWMELDGVQYCGDELNNSSRLMVPASNEIGQRAIVIRFAGSISSVAQFRAIYKQIECQPEPLRPLIPQPQAAISSSLPAPTSSSSGGGGSSISSDAAQSIQKPEVQFREIILRSEFFELNSAKLAKSRNAYDANMFIVYRVKKSSPDVCKLRLMFYRFDLEPSPGCKRDFLDVNNVDRLCGQMSKPEDTRRDYEWPADDSGDFLVSFVSDSLSQREGYLIFGQQIHSNCKASNQQVSPQMPTFDEDQPMSRMTTTSTTTTTTPAPITTSSTTTTTTTTTLAPSTTTSEPTSGGHTPSSSSSSSEGSNCYKLFYEQKFEISSPGWPQRYKPGMTCHYLIHRSEANICSVTFNVVSMILGPDEMDPNLGCDTSSKDHLELGGQLLCGLLSRPQALTVDFDKSQFLTAKFRSVQATGFGFFIEVKQNRCPQLQTPPEAAAAAAPAEKPPASVGATNSRDDSGPKNGLKISSDPEPRTGDDQQQTQGCNRLILNELDTIESERFPHNYKHNQDCLYALRRQNQSICAIDLVLNHFDLEEKSNGSAICDSDYLEIDYSRFCGSYPARHKLRFNYFQDELDKFVRFRSDSSLARSGFSIAVHQISDCNQPQAATQLSPPFTDITNDEIISYLPDVASYSTANLTSPPPLQIVDATTNSTNSPGKRLGFTNSMAQQQHQQLDMMGNQMSSTLCQFVYHKERQYLLSPNYDGRTYDNNLDCLYKIVAKSYDFCSLKLTVVDFDLEQSGDCHNDYLLIDNRRYCGNSNSSSSSSSSLKQTPANQMEIRFSETLPREIHLLFHTSAHHAAGSTSRGFKLLYEQMACNLEDTSGQHFGLTENGGPEHLPVTTTTNVADRETRRQHFGQLSYPRDYVSSGSLQRRSSTTNTGKVDQSRQYQNHRPHSIRPDRVDTQSSLARQPASHGGTILDLDDDLTLRKEIVVARMAPIVAVR